MSLAIKLVIAVIGLLTAILTLMNTVLSSSTDGGGFGPPGDGTGCVYAGGYDACSGSR